MKHESKFAVSCLWGSSRLRVLAHRVWRGVRSILFVDQAGVAGLPGLWEPGGQSEGPTVSGVADGAHRAQAGFLGDRGAQVRMPGMRPTVRGGPPFAPAYASYTHRLETFVGDLRGVMTITDLATVTGLGWDTVKDIVKRRLQRDYGAPRLKDLKRLSIDEIYLGRHRKYYTLVLDLDSGRIVWVANGRGGDALRKFWRALRCSRAKVKAVAMDMSAAYWAAVAEHLPKAAIVFDRFHIVKLVHEKLDDLRREMVREATGLMKKTVKGLRYLLLMRRDNVEAEKLPR